MKSIIRGLSRGSNFLALFNPFELNSLPIRRKQDRRFAAGLLDSLAREVLGGSGYLLPSVEAVLEGTARPAKKRVRGDLSELELNSNDSVLIVGGGISLDLAGRIQQIEPDLAKDVLIPFRISFGPEYCLLDRQKCKETGTRDARIRALAKLHLGQYVESRHGSVSADSGMLLAPSDLAELCKAFSTEEEGMIAARKSLDFLRSRSPEVRDVLSGASASELRQHSFLPHVSVLIALILVTRGDESALERLLGEVDFRRSISDGPNPRWVGIFSASDRVDRSPGSIQRLVAFFRETINFEREQS